MNLSNLKPATLTVLELLLSGPLHTDAHADKHTSNKNSMSTIHSIHLVDITRALDTVHYVLIYLNNTDSNLY